MQRTHARLQQLCIGKFAEEEEEEGVAMSRYMCQGFAWVVFTVEGSCVSILGDFYAPLAACKHACIRPQVIGRLPRQSSLIRLYFSATARLEHQM